VHAPDPRTIARKIETWFARHQRPLPWRKSYDPYDVWVSEVMLQQTRMEVVVPYFERFLERFPTLGSLAAATDRDVMTAWSGLGYYRRARMLREGAAAVMERFDGRIPSTIEELLTIPGIGRYTAGALRSIGFDARAPIVDGNVARVVSRIFGVDSVRDYWDCAEFLANACRSPRALNQGLMEIGALVCKPRTPACLLCPVRDSCVALATGRIDALPPPKPKRATRALRIPLYLIADRKGRVLMRRESGALMNAMYHLPHGDTSLLPGRPLEAKRHDLLGTFRHTITNRKIEFEVYVAELRGRISRDCEWVNPNAIDEVPHPSYVKKALRVWSGSV